MCTLITWKYYQNKKWNSSILGLVFHKKEHKRHLNPVLICHFNRKRHIEKPLEHTWKRQNVLYLRYYRNNKDKTWSDFSVYCRKCLTLLEIISNRKAFQLFITGLRLCQLKSLHHLIFVIEPRNATGSNDC